MQAQIHYMYTTHTHTHCTSVQDAYLFEELLVLKLDMVVLALLPLTE